VVVRKEGSEEIDDWGGSWVGIMGRVLRSGWVDRRGKVVSWLVILDFGF